MDVYLGKQCVKYCNTDNNINIHILSICWNSHYVTKHSCNTFTFQTLTCGDRVGT